MMEKVTSRQSHQMGMIHAVENLIQKYLKHN